MRKFISLFAAVLFAGSMMAAEVTITPANSGWSSSAAAQSGVVEGVTVAVTNGLASSGQNPDQLRIYKNATLTISAESTISKIEFTCTANGAAQYGPGSFAAQEGYTYEVEGPKGTWEGSANSVSFTASAAQVRATQIVVTLGPAPKVATPVIAGDEEFTDSVIVTMTCSTPEADIYYTIDGTTDPKCDCAAAPEYTHELVIKETTTIMAAAYTGNDWSAVATKTFTKVEPLQPITCAEVYNKVKNDKVLLNNVVVTYANGKNVYVQDATGSMLLYLTDNTTWEAGNILSGVQGTLDIYNGLYEVKMTADQVAAVQPGQGEVPAPVEFNAAPVAADMNKYIVLKNVTVSAETFPSNKNMNATIGEETFVLRNNFNADVAFDTLKTYDITGVVAVYNATVQVYFINADEVKEAPAEETVIYDWAENIGTTILGVSGVEISTVKIHTNTDEIPAIKFSSSYKYADRIYLAIKPTDGGFKAGDVLSVAAVFNNSSDAKYAQVDLRAADGDTRIWLSDSASTINGRTSAAEPIIQTYTLEADQDSLLLGRYGNTAMFITHLEVVRSGEVPPVQADNYYVVGSMTDWNVNEAYILIPNNGVEGEYMGEFTFAANDEFKVVKNNKEVWYPEGNNNNYKINQAGDYIITFNPAGGQEGWYEGYYNVVMKEEPIEVPQTLYLKPGPWYYEGNQEKFAIYAWGEGKEEYWSDFMTLAENEMDIWTTEIPAGYTNLIFVRFGNAATVPSWTDNMWSQTEDLAITEGYDMYTITKQDPYDAETGVNPKAEGFWSKYEYVSPAKFYIIGLTGWDLTNLIPSFEDSYVAQLEAGYYEMKVLADGTWETAKGYDDLTVVAEGLSKNETYGNICFTLAEAGNVTITYNDSVFTLAGNFYTGPEPETKYYLVGTITSWSVVAEDKYLFLANVNQEGVYSLEFTLAEGDGIKIVGVQGDKQTWYPDGMGNEYVVDAAHAGTVTILFSPEGGKEGWHEGYFTIETAQGIDNTNAAEKAVKVLINGQLIIKRNGVNYNLNGQVIR